MRPLLQGTLVRLAALNPEELSRSFTTWNRDSELARLLDSDPARLISAKKSQAWMEEHYDPSSDRMYWFSIRAVEGDTLLGDINLSVTEWNRREAFVGLGIGPREFWGRGYGSEAMRLILEYAFLEVNLERVTLTVFEYNQRAVRSYEKCGFQHEGRVRGRLFREGKRWDLLMMSVRRADWMEKNGCPRTDQ